MSSQMTLGDFLKRLEGVYKSVDIRTAAVKINDIWQNALTVIRFSYKKQDELLEQQKAIIDKWDKIQTNNFFIDVQSLDFNMFDALNKNFFNVGKWVLLSKDPNEYYQFGRNIDLLSLKGNCQGYTHTRKEANSWSCFEATDGKHCSLLENERLQSEVKSQNQNLLELYPLINEVLEVNFSSNSAVDLILEAPFYATIKSYDFAEQKCKVQVKYHKDIKDLAVNAILRKGVHEDAHIGDKAVSPIKLDESEELDNYFRFWEKDLSLSRATTNDYLFVNLIQKTIPALDIQKEPSFPMQISMLLRFKKPANYPLLAAFQQFCSLDEFEEHIKKPAEMKPPSPNKPSSAFEGLIQWILGLLGFQSIWLGWTGHETLKEGKIEHLRLDILGYYDNKNTLLLVACTTGSPDQDIDKIESIKTKLNADVFKDTNIQIRSFIFSSQQSVDIAKQAGYKVGVKIFGREDIIDILNCLYMDKRLKALAYFDF